MTQGFTLIELMLYISLLSFMLGGLFSSAITLHDTTIVNKQAAKELLQAVNERNAQDLGIHQI